ncbi:MAG: RdgB/HAM1 family non-canonical purine NTP pyrophosphatase [Myxococcota bacterium]
MRLLFATLNRGKLEELRELVGADLEVVSQAELSLSVEVEEDQLTFEGNAEKKARAFLAASGLPALADDSGLCVEALAGRPGVHSARYAPTEKARIERLLEELSAVEEEQRAAAFRCALCLALPSGKAVIEVGACPGRIAREPKGEGGFGYDPVFFLPELGKTMAQLSSAQKSEVSHRGRAFRKMRPHLLALARGELH